MVKDVPFMLEDFVFEMKYSLWTDLSGEQTEFLEAMDQLSYSQIFKINVFTLFDYSTMGSEMVQVQKKKFAQNIAD